MGDEETQTERTEQGATAVEYGLMIAMIALAIVLAVMLFGDNLAASFQDDCLQMFTADAC